MSTQNVYVIMRGEYSDRHICGVFSTREKAESAISKYIEIQKLAEGKWIGKRYSDLKGGFYVGNFYSVPEIEEFELDNLNESVYDSNGLENGIGDFVKCYYAEIVLKDGQFFRNRTGLYGALSCPAGLRVICDGNNKVKMNGARCRTYWCYSAVSQEHAEKVCIEKRQEYLRLNALRGQA